MYYPQDCIIALFYAVDQERLDVPKCSDAQLYSSAVVPLAIKGGGTRAFSRWLTRADLPLFLLMGARGRLRKLSLSRKEVVTCTACRDL
jgi:hypothetical protein